MGVSGSGKSTVGSLLAAKLGWKFYDADDYHSEENRKKMGQGIPLDDQDRVPWLCCLHDILMRDLSSGQSVVLACSALKKMYRNILARGGDAGTLKHDSPGRKEALPEVKFLVAYLDGSFHVISSRLAQRKGHFMAPELLQSQFDTLEPPAAPENFLQISVENSVSEIVAEVEEALRKKGREFQGGLPVPN
ncbi:probable gluconokinase isoform X1 [Tachyglossus aculeatus]|uniref:probable gluconokinase isoform X1 n=2 Tax=Tachyglossus aculeatus TaxID=9261 RepID=UPI0018F334FE|nr:probable gluconokinase isoform X1 [Tachyglossus aculeatus]